MKKFLLLLLLSLGLTAAATDYRKEENWVICDRNKADAEFDVFYVYPTLFSDREHALMQWENDPKLHAKTVGFAAAQTGIFGARARVFAPFVRQLDYSRCTPLLSAGADWRTAPELAPGAEDTVQAFRFYLEHFNRGRPYILLGHSQGAIDLYRMMLQVPELAAERGFVAAYLLGMPHLTQAEIAADFSGRGIAPATDARGLGVIIGWNTQAPETENPAFTGRGTYCINPLNWSTGTAAADRSANIMAFFYDYRTGQSKTVPNFCGARIDAVRGALLVDLPVNGKYDARGFMGKGVFHMNDVWFFAGNIRDNSRLRVKLWRERCAAQTK